MKMIYAIMYSDDALDVTEELIKANFRVTTLATTGGFLKKGNTTLFIVTEDDRVDNALKIIKQSCTPRKRVSYIPSAAKGSLPIGKYCKRCRPMHLL